jgi:predicted dehydrogenase
MTYRSTRRRFLKTTAATGMGCWVAGGVQAQQSTSPNERIAMASVGIDGKGRSDSDNAAKFSDMVAICDVDRKRLEKAGERFPKAKKYTDFRKMLDEMGKSIDAVTVSTADHTHAPAALMAMRMGKHCFCQKPLTRTIYEARLMGQVAREQNLATQMGNQGTADSGLRRSAALLRAGALGTVSEVHVWTNRPIWPQGVERPAPSTCPDHLDWDLWLGPAPVRPYADAYHPFRWRGWWDFGSGALGDMACHEMNMAFMGLDLRNPTSVQAVTSGHNRDSFPSWSKITYEFPANASRPGLKMVWYDGNKVPPDELFEGQRRRGSSLVIGDKGKLNAGRLFAGAEDMDVDFPKSPGHVEEWINAIRGGPPAMSNFPDYAGPLTETVLLGNLAVWVDGPVVEWDAKNLRSTNTEGLETIVKPEYRQGYTLDA